MLSTSVIRALKEAYPDQPLHLLTDPLSAEIVRHDPHLDKIFIIEWANRNRGKHAHWREIYRLLKSQPYERAAILYPNCHGWNWLCAALRIKHVAQIGATVASFLFGHQRMMRRSLKKPWHMIEAYSKVAELLGAKTNCHIPQIYILEDETKTFANKYPVYANTKHKIILHLGTSPEGSNYSINAFKELSLYLTKRINSPIYVTGSLSDALTWHSPDRHAIKDDLLGKLTLREMACAVSLADLLISNSTGVIHIGAALNRKVLGLYSSDPNNDETKWGPKTIECRILKPAITIYDSECHHDLNNFITKDAIVTAVQELIPVSIDRGCCSRTD